MDDNLPGMIGRRPSLVAVFHLVRRAARATLPVLVVGETGTGKELVARAVHTLSGARPSAFVDVNCAAVPDGLAEGELFGWEQGAFTGAHHNRIGLLDAANGGTLLLDEVSAMPVSLQAKLLRAIEQKDYRRVGGRERIVSSFRLVSAVSEPAQELVEAGRLRADFCFRIAGLVVHLPALRDRGADIALLAQQFLDRATREGAEPKHLDVSALEVLRDHAWPGNVRELKCVMERLALLCDEPAVAASDVIAAIGRSDPPDDSPEALERILNAHGWNIVATAKALGLSRATLYNRLRTFGLSRPATPHDPLAESA